jgi:hypothetical protein
LVVPARPEGCPPIEVVRVAIAARLGADPFDAPGPQVTPTLTRIDGAFRGDLVVGDSAARSFEATTCAAVVESAALAAALTLDPARSLGVAPPPSRVVVVDDSTPAPRPSRLDDVPEAEEDSALPWRFAIYAAPAVDVGLAPAMGWGLLAGGSARHAWGSLGAEARIEAPRTVRVADDAFVDVAAAGGAVLACGHFDPLALCGVGRASSVMVTGRGLSNSRTDQALALAAGLRLVAEAAVWRRLTLGAFLEASVVPLAPRVRDANGAVFFDVSPLLGAAGVRVGGAWYRRADDRSTTPIPSAACRVAVPPGLRAQAPRRPPRPAPHGRRRAAAARSPRSARRSTPWRGSRRGRRTARRRRCASSPRSRAARPRPWSAARARAVSPSSSTCRRRPPRGAGP